MSEIRDDLLHTVDRVFDAHCPKALREAVENLVEEMTDKISS